MDVAQVLIVTAIALAVVAFVVWPMLEPKPTAAQPRLDPDRIEQRIVEYREALRRGTLCERCLYANPDASRFCAQCGARLPAAADGHARKPAPARVTPSS